MEDPDDKVSFLLNIDTKTVFSLCFKAAENCGVKRSTFRNQLNELGTGLKKRTVDHWIERTFSTGTAESPSKKSGRPTALTDENLRLLVGW